MLFLHSLPESQFALTLLIFVATFVYEDGATLLAASLSVSGRLHPSIGLLTAFLGVWVGDMGLYGLGAGFGRYTARLPWLRRYIKPDAVTKAESWFAKHGPLALVMSRAIPGSRLPLYVAAGVLHVPARLFARITAACSAVWVSMIFAIWRYVPATTTSSHPKLLVVASVLFAPWLLGKGVISATRWLRSRERIGNPKLVSSCAL